MATSNSPTELRIPELTDLRSDRERHGDSKSREHICWLNMRRRCHDPRHPYFRYYGGRGIQVCERWRNSFTAFLADMGRCPKGKTLDRFPDNNGNYEPGNCSVLISLLLY